MTKRVPEEKIILYTNRGTWAVRVHIVLRELNLEYEEVIINLDEPRPDWYLKLNPLGKVPTLKYGDEVLRESSTIVQFLTDLYPSQLSPASTDKGAPLWRAKAQFFVDLYMSKVQPFMPPQLMAQGLEAKEPLADKQIAGIIELDPYLVDANPFWKGAQQLTIVEALLGGLIQRLITQGEYGHLHPKLTPAIKEQAPNFWRWANEVYHHSSVNEHWSKEGFNENVKKRSKGLLARDESKRHVVIPTK